MKDEAVVLNRIAKEIIGAAIEVHKTLGRASSNPPMKRALLMN